MSTHLDRKELKRPDAFQDKAGALFEFARENVKALVAGAALLAAVVAAFLLYSHFRDAKNEEANSAFFITQRDFAAAAAKAPKTGDWESALKPELARAEELTKKFKGTQAAYEAQLMMGDAYYDHANYAKAAEYYKQATEASVSQSMKALARHSLAYAYEGAKQYDAAIEQLKQVVGSGEKSLRGDALMALGRNYAAKGDKAKALEQYEQVKKDFPNSQVAKSAEVQKNALH